MTGEIVYLRLRVVNPEPSGMVDGAQCQPIGPDGKPDESGRIYYVPHEYLITAEQAKAAVTPKERW